MLPDNRINLQAPRIDFETEVGLTGQAHDNYPAPQSQPRFDWMRSFLSGILANQSSYEAPTQYRDGTIYFDLNTLSFKVRSGDEWVELADTIKLADGLSLADWYASVATFLGTFSPEITFGGSSSGDGILQIAIPTSLQSQLDTNSKCFLYINGLLIDPRKCSLVGSPHPTTIILTGDISLSQDDTFTASIRSIASSYFYTPDVIA